MVHASEDAVAADAGAVVNEGIIKSTCMVACPTSNGIDATGLESDDLSACAKIPFA